MIFPAPSHRRSVGCGSLGQLAGFVAFSLPGSIFECGNCWILQWCAAHASSPSFTLVSIPSSLSRPFLHLFTIPTLRLSRTCGLLKHGFVSVSGMAHACPSQIPSVAAACRSPWTAAPWLGPATKATAPRFWLAGLDPSPYATHSYTAEKCSRSAPLRAGTLQRQRGLAPSFGPSCGVERSRNQKLRKLRDKIERQERHMPIPIHPAHFTFYIGVVCAL